MKWVALAALLTSACGDDIALPTVAHGELDASATRAACARHVRCGLVDDEATCEALFRPPWRGTQLAALASGQVRYDGVAAARCHAALAQVGCDATARDARTLPAACARVFAGTVPLGGRCTLDEACVSGACDAPACAPSTCCAGVCEERVTALPLGAACDATHACVDDITCGEAGRCEPRALAGEPCRAEAACAFGLACIGATELQAGTCRALPAIGEPCPYGRCAEVGATCAQGTCAPLGLGGAPCTSGAACSPFLHCDLATRACADLPGLGARCAGAGRCAGEAWCDGTTCQAPLETGAPCAADNECATVDECAEGPVFDACTARATCP